MTNNQTKAIKKKIHYYYKEVGSRPSFKKMIIYFIYTLLLLPIINSISSALEYINELLTYKTLLFEAGINQFFTMHPYFIYTIVFFVISFPIFIVKTKEVFETYKKTTILEEEIKSYLDKQQNEILAIYNYFDFLDLYINKEDFTKTEKELLMENYTPKIKKLESLIKDRNLIASVKLIF